MIFGDLHPESGPYIRGRGMRVCAAPLNGDVIDTPTEPVFAGASVAIKLKTRQQSTSFT